MEIKNAVIESIQLETEDYGSLSVWIDLCYGGSGQAFGGNVLYLPKSFGHHKMSSVAGHFIYRVMEIAGVKKWDDLVGKTVRAKSCHSKVEAIGHIVNDDWFCPGADFQSED